MSTPMVTMLNQVLEIGKERNMVFHRTEDDVLGGRTITVEGKELLNFGSCSCLALEHHEDLKSGVIDAVQRFGTQFSSSRTYASVGLYHELETLLEGMFERPVLVSASTTLGHFATIPTLIGDDDAVVLDMQVHASMQMAAEFLKARGVTLTIIRHNDMEALEKKIRDLKAKHRKVWYFADGVYSMYGDYAPLDRLQRLLDAYPSFHLYIDDAHGMSWTGAQGVGYVRSRMAHHERMVLAVSLNKSFAAAGGCLVFPDAQSRDLVRNCGGTVIFAGPIQPPMLGAAIASANLHASGALEPLQRKLAGLVAHCNRRIAALGLPQFQETDSPLFFIPVGMPRTTYDVIGRMRECGFFLNAAAFPATPMKRSGIRFMVTLSLTEADIDAMLDELVVQYVRAIAENSSSPAEVSKTFRIPPFTPTAEVTAEQPLQPLVITTRHSIQEVDQEAWDRIFRDRGNFDSRSLAMIEGVFTEASEPENQWDFYYVDVRDAEGHLVLSTFYTCALVKEDMFSPAAVSERVEERRKAEPYYLTTRSVMLGSLITKGEHLYLDRGHAQWKQALSLLIDHMQGTVERREAGQLLLREFMGEQDAEIQSAFFDLGLVQHPLPNVCMIQELSWTDEADYMSRLGSRYRYDVRREVKRYEDAFVMVTESPSTPAEVAEAYALYERVFERSLEMNVFKLPLRFFEAMCASDEYEVIRLYLKQGDAPAEALPLVGVMFSHVGAKLYSAMIVGLDYQALRTYEVYKQILYRTVWRAWERGCEALDLAYTAEGVKKKVGARPHKATAYLQVMDHFNQAILASMQQAA